MKGNGALKKIKTALSKTKSALVVCHIDPDADTIGSMLATALMLKQLKFDVEMLSIDPIPSTYNFLPQISEIKRSISQDAMFDVAIIVDAGDIGRIGEGISLRERAKIIINIDHHPDNTMFGDINFVEQVSSSAELVYNLCKHLKIPISPDMAICLYTAIITDTGNFRYENTTISTFLIAAELVRRGASPNEIASKIYDTKSISSLKVLALALEKIESSPDGKIVWTAVTDEMLEQAHALGEELTGIVDHLRSAASAQVALLFREEKNKEIKINLRSKEKVNVQKIAAKLGGGGHRRAAGVVLSGSLEEVKKKVLEEVQKHLGS